MTQKNIWSDYSIASGASGTDKTVAQIGGVTQNVELYKLPVPAAVSTEITTAVEAAAAKKLDLSGGTITGPLNVPSLAITAVGQGAVNMDTLIAYVTNAINAISSPPPNPANAPLVTTYPVIDVQAFGTAIPGAVLEISTAAVFAGSPRTPDSVVRVWQADGGTPAGTASGTTYTIQQADVGKAMTIAYTAIKSGYVSVIARSNIIQAVADVRLAPEFTVNPAITVQGGGSPVQGCTLLCSDGTTTPTSTTRTKRWRFLDLTTPGGPYSGYTTQQAGDSFVTVGADVGSQILCEVTPSLNGVSGVTSTAPGPTITVASPAPSPPSYGPRVNTFTNTAPFTAQSGQTYTGLKITSSSPNPCITIPLGVTGVTIEDCDLSGYGNDAIDGGPQGDAVYNRGTGTIVQYCNIHNAGRGVRNLNAVGGHITRCTFSGFDAFGTGNNYGWGTAVETDNCTDSSGILIDFNQITGSGYASDAVSFYQSSYCTFADNTITVSFVGGNANGAPLMMGDAAPGNDPGHDNAIQRNTITRTGGVQVGLLGSSSASLMEYNCILQGVQAYNYSGTFSGVTIQKNVLGTSSGLSFVPDTGVITGWGANVFSGSCGDMPP